MQPRTEAGAAYQEGAVEGFHGQPQQLSVCQSKRLHGVEGKRRSGRASPNATAAAKRHPPLPTRRTELLLICQQWQLTYAAMAYSRLSVVLRMPLSAVHSTSGWPARRGVCAHGRGVGSLWCQAGRRSIQHETRQQTL